MGQLELPLLVSMGRFLSYLLVIYFTNQQLTVYRLLTVLKRNWVDSSSQKNVYPAFDLHPVPPCLPTWLSKVGQSSHYLFKITW